MDNHTFPVIETYSNKLVSIEGHTSSFFQIEQVDLEQRNEIERSNYFSNLASFLNNLDEEAYFKFYRIETKSYMETNSAVITSQPSLRIKEYENPLELLFKRNGLSSDINIHEDYLKFNGLYYRILSLVEFSSSQIDEYIIPNEVDYFLFVKKHSKTNSVSKLESLRTKHFTGFLKAKRDISSEGAYQQAEELLQDVINSDESLFQIELFFLLKSESLENLNSMSTNLISEMAHKGCKLFIEGHSFKNLKSGLGEFFKEIIPGVMPKNGFRSHIDKTSHLKYLLPIQSSKLMNKGLLFQDINMKDIFFNPFDSDLKNRNMLVSGMSGAGKSVFVNKLVHHLITEHPTVILDMGGSYKKLSRYHDGTELIGSFNPFHFRDPFYLREFILSVVDKEKLDNLKRGQLIALIKEYIPHCKSFDELLNKLESEFNGIKFYFEDIKEWISNDKLTVSKLLYVDIDNVPKAIISPLIIYIMEYFKNIQESQKILVFDECWEYIQDHSEFISKCFRTFRKTGAFPIAISQSLNDFKNKNTAFYDAITNNSYFSVLFPQETTNESYLEDFDKDRIESLQFSKGTFSECYLKSKDGKYRKILRNTLTPLELELFHTENGEDEAMKRFLDDFGIFFNTTKDAIDAFVRLRHETIDNYNLDYYNSLSSIKSKQLISTRQ